MTSHAQRFCEWPSMVGALHLMKTVLAPIDFSPITTLVVQEAIALARAIGARLVLFHAVAPSFVRSAEAASPDFESNYVLEAEKYVLAELTTWQQQLRDDGVTAHAVHRIGAAGSQILEQAERLEADYVVMGSHGHGAFYDLLVGSTTMRVLKAAKCGVVIVPAATKSAGNGRAARRRSAPDVGHRARASAASR